MSVNTLVPMALRPTVSDSLPKVTAQPMPCKPSVHASSPLTSTAYDNGLMCLADKAPSHSTHAY